MGDGKQFIRHYKELSSKKWTCHSSLVFFYTFPVLRWLKWATYSEIKLLQVGFPFNLEIFSLLSRRLLWSLSVTCVRLFKRLNAYKLEIDLEICLIKQNKKETGINWATVTISSGQGSHGRESGIKLSRVMFQNDVTVWAVDVFKPLYQRDTLSKIPAGDS